MNPADRFADSKGSDARTIVSPGPVKRVAFILVTLVLVGGLLVLGLEVLLGLLDRARPIVSGWRAPQGTAFRFQYNQLGFRGVPINYSTSDFVVLLIGDSQVQADACSYYWLPERRLDHHLSSTRPVRVFSLAADGWGQDQQLLALREYFQMFRADLVIVWQTPGNDLWNNTFPTADRLQLKPTYWLENGALRGPTSHIGEEISSRSRLFTFYQRNLVSWDRQWERYLPPPYVPIHDYVGPVKTTWQSLKDQKLGNVTWDDMATEKSHQTIYLTPRSPRTDYSVDLTHRLLEEMSKETRAHGGSFMTFWVNTPDSEVDIGENEEAVFVLDGRYYRVSDRQRRATIAETNAGLESYMLRAPTRDWRASPTDGHLNEHAVDEVMNELAETVKRKGGF